MANAPPHALSETATRKRVIRILLVEALLLMALTAVLFLVLRSHEEARTFGPGARIDSLFVMWAGWFGCTVRGDFGYHGLLAMGVFCLMIIIAGIRWPRHYALRCAALLAVGWWFAGGVLTLGAYAHLAAS